MLLKVKIVEDIYKIASVNENDRAFIPAPFCLKYKSTEL